MSHNENTSYNSYEIIFSYPWIGSFADDRIHLNDIIIDLELLI